MAVLVFDRLVALAGTFAQSFKIKYLNFSPCVLDYPGFLKGTRNGSHAGPLDTKHLSQKFLRER